MNIYVYTYIHGIIINENRTHDFESDKKAYIWEGFKGGKRKDKCNCNFKK